ncbi:MAG TPA: 16S rRNA (adenine(1518)-N(6)/adenine(1519)-N(6))-dimethyltransferase RsmA [Patescibacteria group bacterium]|nr:16S rRNA (adenine(1518)-N(6)/adenine(1519)-N(6))-dimethyltransferase RsmA [Patescibacteria group bacterium]
MTYFLTPGEIQSLCQSYGLRPSKDYGQNYLVNPLPLDQMIEAGEVGENDVVVEVGPGFGVLTFSLLETAKKVVAFEIEKKLEVYWKKKIKDLKLENLEIVWGNFLRVSEDKLAGLEKYKVIANIPYQITSPLIRYFLEEIKNPPETLVLMVQKEVGERICAKPGDLSLLSISVQYYAEPEIVAKVPRTYFWPEPKVDSVILRIKYKKRTGADDVPSTKKFFQIVKIGFSQKRKKLFNNLLSLVGKDKEKLHTIFVKSGLDLNVRAEDLSLEQWEQLKNYF